MATQIGATEKDTREFQTIKVEVEGALGRLILNRPERLNAIGATMLLELAEAARWFDRHRELRVVIVSGAGRAFSAGADLRDSPMGAVNADHSWLYRREVGQSGLRAADALEQMHAVTIAQVQGYAVGGGLVLMALCDLRVAADDAVFFIPEIDLGVPLAWGGIPRLVREIGPALTKELVMTCRRFTPAEAKAAGFLNRVVPADQLEREVNQLAAQLLAKPSVPVIITKEHVNAVTRVMSAGITSFADGDALLGSIGEAESRQAARNYTKKALGAEREL
ncbi:MAG: enoyl-CoA hydratase/isomerase family protein [Candidatus Binatus sp.]|uniref:enoyl-CoA hydratase/isomerase family protein n=1 Tax=Candidatus Binatus sp. TaxID=2811406 RepID=UPI002715C3E1|nr:enoyl-CoA hydratase/isomerase family protein [Candidatus Binatus sp.]MDO8432317.1 enoyl-CoA hydratase/isomerase family protein [Candidatus Binatus sp.]